LKTSAHSQAVALARIRTQEKEARLKKLQSEREAASATDELRMIQFTAHRPVASASSKLMSAEERDMWEDYRVNGADFSVGDDVEDQQKQRRRLQEEADVFGLWNPDATARLLGFGGEDARDQVQEDEDDLLAEIMRNVGESCYLEINSRDEMDESSMGCVCGRVDCCPSFWHRSMFQMVCSTNQREARENGCRRDGSHLVTCVV
jgi:hypothetical protein